MDARESLHRISERGADIEQRRIVPPTASTAWPRGRQAPADQQKRQSSADLRQASRYPKGGEIGGIGNEAHRAIEADEARGKIVVVHAEGNDRRLAIPADDMSFGSRRHTKGHDPMIGRVSLVVGQICEAEVPPTVKARMLRELAAWYRTFATRAGNPVIWESRLLTAEELDAEARRLEQQQSG
jgi:hypothetical protein